MKKYKFLLGLLFLSLLAVNTHAQEQVKFVLEAPNAVVKGGQFRLTYILEGGRGTGIDVPAEIEGFDVLYGPAVSQSSSVSIINGKRSSHSSTSYTYTLMAKEEGTFTLPSAKVVVDGKSYQSNTKSLKVMPPDEQAVASQQQQSSVSQPQMTTVESTSGNISSKDIFVRAIFSKTQVYEQEAVVVTFRLYSTLNIRYFVDAKFPEFEGFMVEEFTLPENRQINAENYNGKNYYTLDVKKTLLFPQRSGKITIPSGSVTLVLSVPSGQSYRSFFGTHVINEDVEKTLRTSPVTLTVSQLPEGKPLGFSGGVGTFKLKSSLSAEKVKANEAVTLKLDISGIGNLKLVRNPKLELPKDIETFDPIINNKFDLTNNGLSGTRTIEYPLIPRYPGTYTIPELEFSFFNTTTKKYETLKSPSYTLEVAKDPNAGSSSTATSYLSQKEVEVDRDIRYLKTGDIEYDDYQHPFFGSLANFLFYIIPALILIVSIIVYRKQIKANADVARMKTKRANKVATKRLKLAKKYLNAQNKDKFYEESLRAVWGYLSDKLTIPVSDLSRENIETELRSYGVDQALIDKFISVLDTCEFARYAPSNSDKAMDNLYDDMVTAIGKMEGVIKIK